VPSTALAVVVTVLLTAGTSVSSAPRVNDAAPDRHFLAFVTVRYEKVRGAYEERGTIWTADLDGSNRRRLVAGNAPDISPNGRWIAFLDRSYDLRVVRPEGGSARLLARNTGWTDFKWTPDSSRLGVVIGGSLRVVDVDTGRTVTIDRGRFVWGFSFSPSGSEIVYGLHTDRRLRVTQGGVDIYRASARGGDVRRLTRDRGSDSPVWGPDGIAFARFEPYTLLHPAVELWFMRPDGRGVRMISSKNLAPFAWSRNGRRLLASAVSEVDTHPYAVDPMSGRARALAGPRAEVFTAALSRDGRWVLATRNGTLVQAPWAGGKPRVLARGVDEAADWTR